MLVYLDSVIVIYVVEGPAAFAARARSCMASHREASDQFVVSDLTKLECLVKPLRLDDSPLLRDYEIFFTASDLVQVPLPSPIFERATSIRARYRLNLGDSLHLAVAIEVGCGSFLTNDTRLSEFPELGVAVLP